MLFCVLPDSNNFNCSVSGEQLASELVVTYKSALEKSNSFISGALIFYYILSC